MATTDEQLTKLTGYVTEYMDATTDSRALSEKCRDYKDGIQWTLAEKQELKNRKQPCITNNRVKPKVQFLMGMETQNRTDPKAFPREPGDEESAEVGTEALRFVADNNMSEQKFSEGFETYIVEGVEAHEVTAIRKGTMVEVEHNTLSWDRLFYDPHSRRKDFSDARYLGTLQWMDRDEVQEVFGNVNEDVLTVSTSDGQGETMEDKPTFFFDGERNRIRVFYCYFILKGVWHYAVYTKSGFIIEPEPSKYLDDDGNPEPAFVFQSAFVDREGRRYSEVASYLDIQDEINKRRSKALHLMSVRQTWANKGAVLDVAKHKRELAKPDGHAEFSIGEWGKDFGVIPTGDMAQAQFNLLAEAKNEIDAVGANAALAGTDERSLSGRALQSLQQGGVVELGSLFDGHKYCKNRVYRMFWNRIKQYWEDERFIRVTGENNKIKFSVVNRKVTLEEQIIKEFGEIPPQLIGDPRLQEVVDIENQIQSLDVDIIIDESADTVTLQQEQFDILARLYEANPQAVPFELVIKASQLRNKNELLELIKGGTDEQQAALAQAQEQEKQELKQIAIASQVAKIKKDEADAEKTGAETQKIMVETAVELADAGGIQ